MKIGLIIGLGLLAAGVASAEQHEWVVDTDFSNADEELHVVQVLPSANVPRGGEFRISIVAWSNAGGTDTLTMGDLQVGSGCEIVRVTTDTAGPLEAAISADAILRVIGETCHWQRNVYANDTLLGNLATVHAVGTVAAYTENIAGPQNGFTANTFYVLMVMAALICTACITRSPMATVVSMVVAAALAVYITLDAEAGVVRTLALGGLFVGLLLAYEHLLKIGLWSDDE